jgi:hypothetical protein
MNSPDNRMTIVDLRFPFLRLVFFFVKSALAAIILALIFSLLGLAPPFMASFQTCRNIST